MVAQSPQLDNCSFLVTARRANAYFLVFGQLYCSESIHSAGILHGDIRKENLLVSKSGLTIIDFGSSRKWISESETDKESRELCYILGLDTQSLARVLFSATSHSFVYFPSPF
jgi:serine/threonine protein kinase